MHGRQVEEAEDENRCAATGQENERGHERRDGAKEVVDVLALDEDPRAEPRVEARREKLRGGRVQGGRLRSGWLRSGWLRGGDDLRRGRWLRGIRGYLPDDLAQHHR